MRSDSPVIRSRSPAKRALSDGGIHRDVSKTDTVWVRRDYSTQFQALRKVIGAQQDKIDTLAETLQCLADAQTSTTKTANGLVKDLECALKQFHLGRQTIREQSVSHVSETVKLVIGQEEQKQRLLQVSSFADVLSQKYGMIQEQQSRQRAEQHPEVSTLMSRPSVTEPFVESGHTRKVDRRCASPPDLSSMEWIPNEAQSSTDAPRRIATDSNTVISDAVSKPPLFNAERFGDYKKPIRWWVEMHSGISANELLAAVGLNDTSPAKMVMCDYFQKTAHSHGARTLEGPLSEMDTRYKRASQDLMIRKMAAWNEFRKKPAESFRAYWIRFDRLLTGLKLPGIAWPDGFVYAKALRSMNLTVEQRMLVTTEVEVQQKGENLDELRRVVAKLLEHCPDKHEGELFLNRVTVEADAEETDSLGPEEILATQRARDVKTKIGAVT